MQEIKINCPPQAKSIQDFISICLVYSIESILHRMRPFSQWILDSFVIYNHGKSSLTANQVLRTTHPDSFSKPVLGSIDVLFHTLWLHLVYYNQLNNIKRLYELYSTFYVIPIVILIVVGLAAALLYYCSSCLPAMLRGGSARNQAPIPLDTPSSPKTRSLD